MTSVCQQRSNGDSFYFLMYLWKELIKQSEQVVHWTTGLTSQNSGQNLQDRLGCGSMEGEPAATVWLPKGKGVPQHPPENRDITWSPWQQPAGFTKEQTFEKETAFWNVSFFCNISSLPCSMAARTRRFSSVTAAKLTAASRRSSQLTWFFFFFFWRSKLKFGRCFHTLLQTSERHLGRSLEYLAGWCSHSAPLHHFLHRCSSLIPADQRTKMLQLRLWWNTNIYTSTAFKYKLKVLALYLNIFILGNYFSETNIAVYILLH